jgi:hypothetical protein
MEFNRLLFVAILAALSVTSCSGSRVRRQLNVIANACPDANTNVCRSCSCSPQTARFVKNGELLVAPVNGLPFSNNSTCDQCCFQRLVVSPQCPIDVLTNQNRPALQAAAATFNFQNVNANLNSARSFVGCCPFTPCQSGYSCMFDLSNALWLCCGV